MLKVVFRGTKNQGPSGMNELYQIYQPKRSLRSVDQLLILSPRTHTKLCEKDITAHGCHYWNDISIELKSLATIDQIKTQVSEYDQFNS